MSDKQTNNKDKKSAIFFESITDFVMRSRRLIVFHEECLQDKTEEVYYLMLPKESVDKKLHNAFTQLSLTSYEAINYLSVASQADILRKLKNQEVFFIYLDKLKKESPEEVSATRLEIKKNLPEIILTLYPELEVRIRAEGNTISKSETIKADNYYTKIIENESKPEHQNDLIDYFIDNHKEIAANIKNETIASFQQAKSFLFKKVEQVAPDLQEAKKELKSGGASLIEEINKQVSILKKMKK